MVTVFNFEVNWPWKLQRKFASLVWLLYVTIQILRSCDLEKVFCCYLGIRKREQNRENKLSFQGSLCKITILKFDFESHDFNSKRLFAIISETIWWNRYICIILTRCKVLVCVLFILMCLFITAGAPNYYPNSFSGPEDNKKHMEHGLKNITGDVTRLLT